MCFPTGIRKPKIWLTFSFSSDFQECEDLLLIKQIKIQILILFVYFCLVWSGENVVIESLYVQNSEICKEENNSFQDKQKFHFYKFKKPGGILLKKKPLK